MGKVINVDGTKFSFGSSKQGVWMEQCLYQHVLEIFASAKVSYVMSKNYNSNLANFVSHLMQGKILLSKKDRHRNTNFKKY